MGTHSAKSFGAREAAGRRSDPPRPPSSFQRELEAARRHLAKLEAEALTRQDIAATPVRFDESPLVARACSAAIWAIVALPFVLGLVMLVRRLAG